MALLVCASESERKRVLDVNYEEEEANKSSLSHPLPCLPSASNLSLISSPPPLRRLCNGDSRRTIELVISGLLRPLQHKWPHGAAEQHLKWRRSGDNWLALSLFAPLVQCLVQVVSETAALFADGPFFKVSRLSLRPKKEKEAARPWTEVEM